MTTFQNLIDFEANNGSIANGWSAVLAISQDMLNGILVQQFADDADDSRGVGFKVSADGRDAYVFARIGAPMLTFSGQQIEMTTTTVDGMIAVATGQGTVDFALGLQGGAARIAGACALADAAGSATSEVVLDLTQGEFTASVAGLHCDDGLAGAIESGLIAGFTAVYGKIVLGSVAQSSDPLLNPVSFSFAVQPDPGGGDDGCVLVQIETDGGPAGQPNPLPVYPIPDGADVGLVIANPVLCGLLAEQLGPQIKALGATVGAVVLQGAGLPPDIEVMGATGGAISLAEVQQQYPTGLTFTPTIHVMTSDSNGDDASIGIPAVHQADGDITLNIAPAKGGGLTFGWAIQWTQFLASYYDVDDDNNTYYQVLKLNASGSYNVSVDTSSAIAITWNDDLAVNVDRVGDIHTYDAPWPSEAGAFVPFLVGNIEQSLPGMLQNAISGLAIAPINTFVLQNLLFPSSNGVKLSAAAAPGDLIAAGNVQPLLAASPASATLGAGESVTFAVSSSDGQAHAIDYDLSNTNIPLVDADDPALDWGEVSVDGTQVTYTAPQSVAPDYYVNMLLQACDDASRTGYFLIRFSESTVEGKAAFSPDSGAIIGQDQPLDFQVLDPEGQPYENLEVSAIKAPPGRTVAAADADDFTLDGKADIAGGAQISANLPGGGSAAAEWAFRPSSGNFSIDVPQTVSGSATLQASFADGSDASQTLWFVEYGQDALCNITPQVGASVTLAATSQLQGGASVEVYAVCTYPALGVASATCQFAPS